ncbi:hypothetical protein ACH4Y0_02825 [Streptomyces sp. NPDC020707]|uniref:hypothetical protein n=1 Tax=Streptomyces sp. NPDC020707 TaxID=3365084 RepID=UPI00378B1D66
MQFGPQITDEEKRKHLHVQASGSITYVFIFGKVIGTVAEVRNDPGLIPEKVYEANSGERGVHGERRDTLNEALSEILRR